MRKMLCVIVAVLWGGTARAAAPNCRALDANDGALILEAAHWSAAKCTTLLKTAMKKRRCAQAAKGKQIEFMSHYDHKGVRGKIETVTCGVVELPKCRATDLRTKKTIAEAAQTSSTRCAKRKPGTRIAYATTFEHRGVKRRRSALVCR